MSSYSAVGQRFTYWSLLDNSGYVIGTANPLAPAADSGSGRLLGVSQIGLTLPQSRDIAIEGDNANLGSIKIAGNANATGQILTRINNPTFVTAAQTLLTKTIGDTDFAILGAPCPIYAPMVVISNAPAINQSSGSVGDEGYEVTIYLRTQIQPRGTTQISDAQTHDYTHDLLGQQTDTLPWGEGITNTDYNVNRGVEIDPFFSVAPMTFHSATGAITTFTVDETPYGANGNDVMVWKNHVLCTYNASPSTNVQYSVVAATKTITFGAALAANDHVVVLYRFVPYC